MTAAERAERTRVADERCRAALEKVAGSRPAGVALVAVGGYGREELAPFSDLDVVLVHADHLDVHELAAEVWYPLWDAGVPLDHSVRALAQATEAAREDPRVALGLLDARHLAGDPATTLQLRTALLAHWRRDALARLPELQDLVRARVARTGELAHAAVPDLKESWGGLRDATIMKALVASWLVDVPHADLERSRLRLLDVRDELHAVLGRGSDRVPPEAWGDLAARLALDDAQAAQAYVREVGRRLAHLSRLTWRRVDGALARPRGVQRRVPRLDRVAVGVAVSSGEVVLDGSVSPAQDPLLLLRAAAEAAERGLGLSPVTAARLAREAPEVPWEATARDLLTRLLAAGPGLLEVWETLEETGALDRLLPEWERVRLLPHASVVHRFTVDRHLVETCIEGARLIRRVSRPDVLMTAALLHDIGKGGRHDHSAAGAPVAAAVAARLGFDDRAQELVGRLVRWHLLLAETATTRDLEDPATLAHVAGRVVDVETLELLAALTEADARATSAQAWTGWRERLVRELVRRTAAVLEAGPAGADREPGPAGVGQEPGSAARVGVRPGAASEPATELVTGSATGVVSRGTGTIVEVHPATHGSTVRVTAPDRIGLFADIAGALALMRLSVRSARVSVDDDLAVTVWQVAETDVEPAVVRQRLETVEAGGDRVADRLGRLAGDLLDPLVLVRHDASREATVIEVRAGDRPGVVHQVCAALARQDLSIRSAHVGTIGPQAVDVFYVVEQGAGVLSDERAAAAVHAVRSALSAAVTLDA